MSTYFMLIGKSNFRLAQSIKALLALAIFFTHGLACYVATDVTWADYIKKRFADSPKELTYEYITKIIHVLITCEYKN